MRLPRWTFAIVGPLVALLVAVTPANADQHLAASSEFIQSLADRAITTLTAEGQTSEKRRQEFRGLFREGFAINGIARFVLGRYWRGATEADRTEYMVLFEDVIVNTWADRFSEYSGEKFEVQQAIDAPSAHQAEQVAIVRSMFFTDPQTPIRIDWRVASRGDIYKITDVSVEGISMANTQRDEFSSVIRSNSGKISALLDILRKKRDG
ncbi:MAG: ABC transporter substrate-binding protein [Alphaproteobacteria bacterium]|nr:ABC transporter substrate-binding protein [Alphaproteobacteria bacterium]